MSIPGSAEPLLLAQQDTGGYQIARSLRFNSSDSSFCLRTPSSNGTSYTTWTWSMWVKRGAAGGQVLFSSGVNTSDYLIVNFEPNDALRFVTGENGVSNQNLVTTAAVFRDYSAWYHLVIQADFGNATQADRIKIYVNGERQAISGSIAAQNYAGTTFNRNGIAHNIGRQGNAVSYFSGYLADVHFIDGQALTPSSFTEVSATTGQLIPKQYTGSFGTNGFWLKFSDNSAATASTLGKDYSGNSNNWTPNNLSVTAGAGNDSLVDTPSSAGTDTGLGGQVTGNYCTWNPLDAHSSLTITNGNLDLSNTAGTTRNVRGTIGFPSSGKWYYEVTPGGSVQGAIGIGSFAVPFNAQNAASSVTYFEDGSKGVDASRTAYGSSYASGDVIGIAFNADTNQVTFYKNGVSQGALSTTAGVQYFPFIVTFNATYSANFGQRAFAYPVSGFKCLADVSLPAPVVAKPNTVMDVKLYTGNGSTQTISGLGFSPDLVWYKQRDVGRFHRLYDTIRGSTNALRSDSTSAEESISGLTAFTSTGFTVGSDLGGNENNGSYVAWAWDAGTTTTTNTAGSITSQVRANAGAGFSVFTYTGTGGTATVGHGLGVAPAFVLIKERSPNTDNWNVYHASLGNSAWLQLNLTNSVSTGSEMWNNTSPTSTVMTVRNPGAGGYSNRSGANYVAYAWAPVAGYSAFGSYTGNGSADGPFVYTGFRPRWVMIKRSDTADHWVLQDTARDPYNIASQYLLANLSNAEGTSAIMDITSNGFKQRNTFASNNASGGTYVWAAFAESPFQYARAR